MQAAIDGLLVVDKPVGLTSREVVDRALRWFPRRTRMGHTGTLDPLATGVLVLCLGQATRLTEYVQRMAKTYRSLFRLGATSDTDDADGTVRAVPEAPIPSHEAILTALAGLIGTIEQKPPVYSAARVTGKRAYALARQGEEVNLHPRTVQVHAIDVLRYDYPDLEVEVRCGKGTYIRSLARDLGEKLGCGAYVQALRRTQVGPFTADSGLSLDVSVTTARDRLLPMGLALAELPRVVLALEHLQRVRKGQSVNVPPALAVAAGEVGVFAATGQVIAVAEVDPQQQVLRPLRVVG